VIMPTDPSPIGKRVASLSAKCGVTFHGSFSSLKASKEVAKHFVVPNNERPCCL
jgi:hypothetical protein